MEGNLTENLILRDWFTFTSKHHDPKQIVEALGLSGCAWTAIKGWYGYKCRLYFGGISIHYDGSEDMGVCCEMSGQGCRNFEEYSTLPGKWEGLIDFVLSNGLHITRLDVAFDDHTGVLDIERLENDTRKHLFVSKFRKSRIEYSMGGEDDPVGISLYYGSSTSDTLLRIYDKAVERGYTDGRHWVRVELQLRDERAAAFMNLDIPLGEAFAGVLLNYLRFVEPNDSDSNKRRWSMAEYWAAFLGDASKISLYTAPGTEYNVAKCKHYVVDMAGNAVAAMIDVCGSLDDFFTLIENRSCAPNPKYEIMLKEHHAYLESLARKTAALVDPDSDPEYASQMFEERRRLNDERFEEFCAWQTEVEGKMMEHENV